MVKISASDLPKQLPLFPLPGALLLPRARLPLNIFEPRYLAMVDDALKSDTRLIGMIQPRKMPEGTGAPSLYQIGCAGRITSLSETDDGRYLITLAGISRFRIMSENQGFTPYISGEVEWASFAQDLGPKDIDHGFDRPAFLKSLKRYFEHAGLSSDWDSMKDAEEELLINSLSMLCPFSTEEKQALLEAPSLQTRRETLVTLINFALAGDNDSALQ